MRFQKTITLKGNGDVFGQPAALVKQEFKSSPASQSADAAPFLELAPAIAIALHLVLSRQHLDVEA